MTLASAFYGGHVMHRRVRPRRHALRYSLFMLLLDLDELDALSNGLRLLSRNRRNLFTFRDRDHGDGTAQPLRAQVERHLTDAGLEPDGGAIRLLTMPRILGFAFNPLSVYFCHRRGGSLHAILYEVSNTFGERHSYLLPVEPGAKLPIHQATPKAFHVSPFLGMDMRYAFRVIPPGERLSIAIVGSDGDGPVITAALSADRRPLSDRVLASALFLFPLLTLKVVAGILWEAIKLWTKGVPVHDRPAPPTSPITSPMITRRTTTASEAACI